jgi:5,6-dimethylbenzimidazole synthase
LIKANEIRQQVKESFVRERDKTISMLDSDKTKQNKYLSLKLEGILDSAINICVTYDPTRFGPFVLGRTSIAETGVYSVCCAIQNLWLAARAEGIGIGWVSILANEDLQRILSIPDFVKPVAYLCLGYVSEFSDKPDLEKSGWLTRMGLEEVICFERWAGHKDGSWEQFYETMSRLN